MTDNLDITLTLSEYVRRMTSADAAEWLPTPSETVVLIHDGPTKRRVVSVCELTDNSWQVNFGKGFGAIAYSDTKTTVSRIPY